MNPRDESTLRDQAQAYLEHLRDEARSTRFSRVTRWRSLLAVGLYTLADRLAPDEMRVVVAPRKVA